MNILNITFKVPGSGYNRFPSLSSFMESLASFMESLASNLKQGVFGLIPGVSGLILQPHSWVSGLIHGVSHLKQASLM